MREPVFNGSFYPKYKGEIEEFIDSAIAKADIKEDLSDAKCYVAPHAGFIYSGYTAAYTYKAMESNSNLKDVDTVVLIGPNHTGIGTPLSVSFEDWRTPLDTAKNDLEFSKELVNYSDNIYHDESAHADEHSLEVQLPFLQRVVGKKKYVFACMGDQEVENSELLSKAIISTAQKLKRNIIVLASSDFDHYEKSTVANKKDMKLAEYLKDMDYIGFNKEVKALDDSICGFGPITVALLCSKYYDAKNGKLLNFSNSGDKTGDYDQVVDYMSWVFI